MLRERVGHGLEVLRFPGPGPERGRQRREVRGVRAPRVPRLQSLRGGQEPQDHLCLSLAPIQGDLGFEALDTRQLNLIETPCIDRT